MFAFGFLKLNFIFISTRIVKFVLNGKFLELMDCFSGLGGRMPCRNL